jgi:16S rRNA G1207 methylase RsmC
MNLWQGDFLDFKPEVPFDFVAMNPPFSRQQDIDHTLHAFGMLAPGGTLVGIVSESAMFRSTAKSNRFRDLVTQFGETEKLPADAFKESGTMVQTRMVMLRRPS